MDVSGRSLLSLQYPRAARLLGGHLAWGVLVASAVVQAFTPDLAPVGTIAFLAMAAALGAGSGAVFAALVGATSWAAGFGLLAAPLVAGWLLLGALTREERVRTAA